MYDVGSHDEIPNKTGFAHLGASCGFMLTLKLPWPFYPLLAHASLATNLALLLLFLHRQDTALGSQYSSLALCTGVYKLHDTKLGERQYSCLGAVFF